MPKRYLLLLVMLLALVLCGCSKEEAPTVPTETTEPPVAATIPADGDPDNVTCKGTYFSDNADPQAVVARAGDQELTNEGLQVWYALEVAAWQQETARSAAPDFSQPLDTQPCPVDETVNSWQQFFLKRALNTWQSVCALELQARELPIPTEDAYQPNLKNYEIYLQDIPATDYLYGYNPLFQPNSMHSAWLDALPEYLNELAARKGFADPHGLAQAMGVGADALTEAVRLYNYSYMYFTDLSYYIEPRDPEGSEESPGDYIGRSVDFRQILLVPEGAAVAPDGTVTCTESDWAVSVTLAEELLDNWQKKQRHTEAAFSDLAYKQSMDTGSALGGGLYRDIRQGSLPEALESWCFDEARQPGDTTILQTPYGIHILYFREGRDASAVESEEGFRRASLKELVNLARKRYPAQIDYSAMALTQGETPISASDVLYPDIAHERFPEIPLYLQQDYPDTMYGGFKITTNGCGITSMAMLASYMADDALTPPVMCERFGRYSHRNGTDGMIFNYEPSGMGFFLREKTHEPSVAKAALEEGQIVISVQHKGYWTRGGHYIVLEDINEEGLIQVRDSNIYNYGKIHAHKEDRHTWGNIVAAGSGYWIFEDKVTRLPMCSRCGEADSVTPKMLSVEYTCEKCALALLRRNAYLSICPDPRN